MSERMQMFLALLNYKTYVSIVLFTELINRLSMAEAFCFKKNKRRLKKENAQRSRMYKIFGFYHLSQTNAPHHMKRYAITRICNVFSFVFTTIVYLFIPHFPKLRTVFLVSFILHALYLIGSETLDFLVLAPIDGKRLNFDCSKKP